MTLNYLILAHKELSQVERLIKSLQHRKANFFLHIDKKNSFSEENKQSFKQIKNLKIIKSRLEVQRGGVSMIEATLLLLKKASVANQKAYFILLSGQDFPLKPAEEIFNFLSVNYGKEFLEYFFLPSSNWAMNGGLDRINYYWFIDLIGEKESHYLYMLQRNAERKRNFFDGIHPCGGSQWWCLTSECVAFILKCVKENKAFKKYYSLSFVPDEMFFHTIILNSAFKSKVENNNLRYIDWRTGPQYPRVLQESDLEQLIICNKFWARKFEVGQSSLLDKIEKHLHI